MKEIKVNECITLKVYDYIGDVEIWVYEQGVLEGVSIKQEELPTLIKALKKVSKSPHWTDEHDDFRDNLNTKVAAHGRF